MCRECLSDRQLANDNEYGQLLAKDVELLAKWLDENKSNWFLTVSILLLDMQSLSRCVLGQVFRDYCCNERSGFGHGIELVYETNDYALIRAKNNGAFSSNEYRPFWVKAIESRIEAYFLV